MDVYLNGEYIDESNAKISIWDRGFLLGDGIFETVKVVDSKGEYLKEHFARLCDSSKRTGIPIPIDYEALMAVIGELCKRNSLSIGALRMTLTRGESQGGLSFGEGVKPTLLITLSKISKSVQELSEIGISVVTCVDASFGKSESIKAVKATNYLVNIMGKHYAESQGADDVLFVDDKGWVLELSTANFFYVMNGEVFTPPLNHGILPGITRSALITRLESENIHVKERDLQKNELKNLEEAFMTSSVRGVIPIVKLNGNGLKGRIYSKMSQKVMNEKKDNFFHK